MKPPSRFLAAVMVALAVLTGFNGVVRYMARNSVPRKLMRHVLNPEPREVLVLGDSLPAAGIDEAELNRSLAGTNRPPGVLNAALGASSTVEHLLLCRAALRAHPEIRTVVYARAGMFEPAAPIKTLFGNRALSFQVEPELAASYYTSTPAGRLAFRLLAFVPMVTERAAVWFKVELCRRYLGRLGLAPEAQSRFGRASDFAPPTQPVNPSMLRKLENWVSQQPQLAPPVNAIFDLCRKRGLRVIVLEMPIAPSSAPSASAVVGTPLEAFYRKRIHEAGADYWLGHDWVQDPKLFADPIHLNPTGAIAFSQRLGLEMRRRLTPVR